MLDDNSIETKFVIIDKTYWSKSIIGLPILLEFKLIENVNLVTFKC